MVDVLLTWLVFGAFAAAIAWTLAKAELRWFQGRTVRRSESPLQYWAWSGVFLVVTLVVLMAALAQTFGG